MQTLNVYHNQTGIVVIKLTFPLNFGFRVKKYIFEAGITVYYWEWSVFQSG